MKKYIVWLLVFLSLASNVYAEGKYKILNVTFQLTDDKDFSGEATYYYKPTEKIQFTIKNISKSSYSFAGASYFIALRDGKIYPLNFSSILNLDASAEKTVSKPQELLTIVCTPPQNFNDIKGVFIALANKRKIYFEYEELTNPRTLLRKTAEVLGLGEDKDKKHPATDGWKKVKTSSGKVYYVREEKNETKSQADGSTSKQ